MSIEQIRQCKCKGQYFELYQIYTQHLNAKDKHSQCTNKYRRFTYDEFIIICQLIGFFYFLNKKHMEHSIQLPCCQANSQQSIELSSSLVFIDQDYRDDAVDYHPEVTDRQPLKESRTNISQQEVNARFKKDLTKSVHFIGKKEVLLQKSQAVLHITNSRIQDKSQKISSKKMIENDLLQFETISQKTEELVFKQQEQRRQLKKLKKLYIQKVQEMMKQQQNHKGETNYLNHQIIDLKTKQEKILLEKSQLEAHIKRLEMEMYKTKQELNNFEEEKLELLRRIEILQINYDLQIESSENNKKNISQQNQSTDRINNIIHQNSELNSINYQLNTINQMIQKANSQSSSKEQDYKKIINLLCIKNQYLQQRQIIKVQEDQKIYRKAISKLNEAVITRDKLITNKNQIIENLKNNIKQYPDQRDNENIMQNPDQNDKLMEQTKESCFGKSARTSLIKSIIIKETSLKNKQDSAQIPQNWREILTTKIGNVVKANTIIGQEQTYVAMQKLILALVQMLSIQNWNQENLLKVIENNLEAFNKQLIIKAQANVQKIQKLMKYLQILGNLAKNKQNGKQPNSSSIEFMHSNTQNKLKLTQ